MIYLNTAQNAKLPPLKIPQSDFTWSQGRVQREGLFRGKREDTCAQTLYKLVEENWC
ncbi:hypothetical protein GGI35DRAFT_465386 [Trichoderma velutinum]